LFRQRGFPAALVTSALFFAVLTGLMSVVVLELQLGAHAGVLIAGLSLLPWSVGMGLASWAAGSLLVPRFGLRVRYAGLVLLLAGVLGAITVYTAAGPGYPAPLLLPLGICGLGLGLFSTPFFTAALGQVRPAETGSAAGLLNAVQQFGGTLGVAVLGTVFLHGSTFPAGAATACWVAVAFLVATAAATALMTTGQSTESAAAESTTAAASVRTP
jgi:MFS family permease